MNISVIIPNFNGRLLLEKNLPFVIKESGNSEIIVVDDASTDDSVKFLDKNFPGVKVIKKSKNSGYSSTVNLGVKSSSGDLIVLLNSDAYPKAKYLDYLIPYFKNPSVFAVGMLHESLEAGKTVLRGRGKASFQKGFLIHSRGEIDKNDTYWVNGGAGLFRKSIWLQLGGLREIYDPFYWEDIDLSFRAVNSGYKIFFEPKAKVVHSQKKGAIRTKYSQSQIKTIAYRNQFLFVWLNLNNFQFILKHIVWLPYHFLTIREKEFYMGFIKAIFRIIYYKNN